MARPLGIKTKLKQTEEKYTKLQITTQNYTKTIESLQKTLNSYEDMNRKQAQVIQKLESELQFKKAHDTTEKVKLDESADKLLYPLLRYINHSKELNQ